MRVGNHVDERRHVADVEVFDAVAFDQQFADILFGLIHLVQVGDLDRHAVQIRAAEQTDQAGRIRYEDRIVLIAAKRRAF